MDSAHNGSVVPVLQGNYDVLNSSRNLKSLHTRAISGIQTCSLIRVQERLGNPSKIFQEVNDGSVVMTNSSFGCFILQVFSVARSEQTVSS